MGYAGKLEEKEKALRLRRQGLSYSEIKKRVPVSKDTLSRWCRDVILTPEHLERITQERLNGAARGRIIGAKRQQANRVKRTKQLLDDGRREVGKMNKRDRFVAGIALYLGDGLKGDKAVGFSNSNPKIISFMMGWFREFCQIPEERFRGQIWIHENQDEPKARNFWSQLTGIPLDQFQKSYIARNKSGSKKIRKNLHEYGVFATRVSSVKFQRKILGWTAGILEN